LVERGFNCPQPVFNIHGQDKSKERIVYDHPSQHSINGKESESVQLGVHIVRLLTYVPGQLIVQVPYTPSLLHSVGQHLGRVENALQTFSHSALDIHQTIWDLDKVPELSSFTYAIQRPEDLALVKDVMKVFAEDVQLRRHQFQRGTIHGDYNEQNILVQQCSTPVPPECSTSVPPECSTSVSPECSTSLPPEYTVYGLIDFGDSLTSYYVYEVAIAIMYMMLDSKVVDVLDVGGHILVGYLRERSLNEVEIDCLKTCIAARFAQSLTLGAYSFSQDPSNPYIMATAKNGWSQLRALWNTPRDVLYQRWNKIMIDVYKVSPFFVLRV